MKKADDLFNLVKMDFILCTIAIGALLGNSDTPVVRKEGSKKN